VLDLLVTFLRTGPPWAVLCGYGTQVGDRGELLTAGQVDGVGTHVLSQLMSELGLVRDDSLLDLLILGCHMLIISEYDYFNILIINIY
jgi:hypothetical protein